MKRILIPLMLFILTVFPGNTVFPGSSMADPFFSDLRITEVSVKGHKLHIKGETDLPEGSVLNMHLRLPGWDKPGKGIKVHANHRRFFIQVDLPKKKGWEGSLVQLKVHFRPGDQPDHVKVKVGTRGEKLKGPNVKVLKEGKELEENMLLML